MIKYDSLSYIVDVVVAGKIVGTVVDAVVGLQPRIVHARVFSLHSSFPAIKRETILDNQMNFQFIYLDYFIFLLCLSRTTDSLPHKNIVDHGAAAKYDAETNKHRHHDCWCRMKLDECVQYHAYEKKYQNKNNDKKLKL